jgi:hypothetical protein
MPHPEKEGDNQEHDREHERRIDVTLTARQIEVLLLAIHDALDVSGRALDLQNPAGFTNFREISGYEAEAKHETALEATLQVLKDAHRRLAE